MQVFLCIIIFFQTANSWAQYYEQIDEFRREVLQPYYVVDEDILYKVPHFDSFTEVSTELYDELKVVSSGAEAQVWVGRSKVDRPNVGLKEGQPLAIRGTSIDKNRSLGGWKAALATITTFIKAQKILRNPNTRQVPTITEFFPIFYGTYQALGKIPDLKEQQLNFQEMEYVDETFKKYGRNLYGQLSPYQIADSVVFEYCLGEWAGGYFANIGKYDFKNENYGLKKIDYSRTYKINGKEFIISFNEMPKRLDVGGTGSWSDASQERRQISMKKFFSCSVRDLGNLSDAARKFVRILNDHDKTGSILDTFDSFYKESSELQEGAKKTINNRIFNWPQINFDNI